MKYGYARVSGTAQELELQRQELLNAGANFVYAEKFTGMKKDRPEWNRLMEQIKEGDTLIVAKLDRIARSVKLGLEIVDELVGRGVSIEVLNMGKFDSTPNGKLLRSIMFAFAEFERDMIVERTNEGKKYARENNPNYKEGRKPVSERIKKRIALGDTNWREMGISRATFYKYGGRMRSEDAMHISRETGDELIGREIIRRDS